MSPPEVKQATSRVSRAERWDHFLARLGVNRMGHRVKPGLYALGEPGSESAVLVTANYTLSFDALRSSLNGTDAYLLVLDTDGINVWCAAGKGTFGTDELVSKIEATGLANIVSHRRLILPQLGAAGVSAHEVRDRSGFTVEFGPVRAADLAKYLKAGRATSEMRRVRFPLLDRIVLIPVELKHALLPSLVGAVIIHLLAGGLAAVGIAASVLAGIVAFPILLPWLPFREFSAKGFVLGAVTAAPFAAVLTRAGGGPHELRARAWAAAYALVAVPITAYLALNFTGSTPFTSRSGVRREILRYVPVMAGMAGGSILLAAVLSVLALLGAR
jgi:hypothetical protein